MKDQLGHVLARLDVTDDELVNGTRKECENPSTSTWEQYCAHVEISPQTHESSCKSAYPDNNDTPLYVPQDKGMLTFTSNISSLKCSIFETFPFGMVTLFSVETTYLDSLTAKSG